MFFLDFLFVLLLCYVLIVAVPMSVIIFCVVTEAVVNAVHVQLVKKPRVLTPASSAEQVSQSVSQ